MLKSLKNIELGKTYWTKTKYPEEYIVLEILSSRLHLGGVKIKYTFGGQEKFYDARDIRKGGIKSLFSRAVFGIGYMGDGPFSSVDSEGKPTRLYNRWKAVLGRCYNGNNPRITSYDTSTVSDEWLNFQTFAYWLSSQKYYLKNYDIDKNLLSVSGTNYSAENCCMLPPAINTAIVRKGKNTSNGLPCGVHWHAHNCCYTSTVHTAYSTYQGSFQSVEAAWKVAKKSKEEYVKTLANKFKENLDEHVYNALMAWEQEPYHPENIGAKAQNEPK